MSGLDLVVITATVTVILWQAYLEWGGPIPYRGRACAGMAWRRAFPTSPKDHIRAFLRCFVDGMAIDRKMALKFHPHDQIMDVYRSLYGGVTPRADHLECETFIEGIAAEFGLAVGDILAMWHGRITLGELFAYATTGERG